VICRHQNRRLQNLQFLLHPARRHHDHTRKRIITVLGGLFHLLVSFCVSISVVIEFQRQELMLPRGQKRKRVEKRRRADDELALTFMVAVLESESQYNLRRFWVDTRSNHWITYVLDGVLLQEEQFTKMFRMNRNSFDILHGLLGMHFIQT